MPQSIDPNHKSQSLFEEARRYFADHWKWYLHEDTFEALDKDTWICKVTTMFLAARGDGPERSFYLLSNYGNHFTLEAETLPVLLDWCLKMAAKKGDTNEPDH